MEETEAVGRLQALQGENLRFGGVPVQTLSCSLSGELVSFKVRWPDALCVGAVVRYR